MDPYPHRQFYADAISGGTKKEAAAACCQRKCIAGWPMKGTSRRGYWICDERMLLIALCRGEWLRRGLERAKLVAVEKHIVWLLEEDDELLLRLLGWIRPEDGDLIVGQLSSRPASKVGGGKASIGVWRRQRPSPLNMFRGWQAMKLWLRLDLQ